ncbi:sodium:alanine symporter family protein [Nocardiopsis sp. MG754419]|uniref:alanine/glycine:cation symporter family protein n=1 Tax=Nocardiopsis sp. MG754419 TaxID=2259865 RepID=UPI001BADFA1C|nr:sodium:alanine symporter family protein [Nocardiopsis sp. MG754419]MBR8740696.1 sodium:alanine symporter family protein [Nocardiopsis sp. MG754419]
MDQLLDMAGVLSDIIWGPLVLIPLLLLTGVFLTIRLNLLQFTKLGHALWLAFVRRKESDDQAEGDISHYQALSTALAATVGVGNIAGVGLAIGIGGPGALFWMWVTALFGMATKYSEALLGVKYRIKDEKGEQAGGPMYYLRNGLPGGLGVFLGGAFAVFGAIAAFGIGNGTQAEAVTSAVNDVTGIDRWIIGAVLMVLVAIVILGGIKSIGRFASAIVPFMIIGFIFMNLLVLMINWEQLLPAFQLVFSDAFTGTSAAGGFAGATLMMVIRTGVARGIFSNESGLGTGAIAAAAAKTTQPVRQAMVSMTQTFIDTIIMVTLTAMMIITSGLWNADEAAGYDPDQKGVLLTSGSMEQSLSQISPALGSFGVIFIAGAVAIFAYTTILGWSYYGERCMVYLAKGKRFLVLPYRLVFIAVVFVGATASIDAVWLFSDIANGLMALPNLVGLLLLSPVIVAETRKFFGYPNWKDPDAVMEDVRK